MSGHSIRADVADVRALHLRWLWGWDKEPGAGHWDFRAIQGLLLTSLPGARDKV